MVMLYAADSYGNILQEEYCQTKYSRVGNIKDHVGRNYLYCLSLRHDKTIKAEAMNAQGLWVTIPHTSLPKAIQMKILTGAI